MDFVGKRRWFFLLSLLVILPGVVFLVKAQGLNPGIDFTGGSTMTVEFAAETKQEDLRQDLADLGYPDTTVQKLGDGTFFIRTVELDEADRVTLASGLGLSQLADCTTNCVLAFDLVSPVVARETVVNAFWAILAAAVGIFFYVWWAFRHLPRPFRYGVAAIVALIHDAVIVIGIFAILGDLADLEVNTMFLVGLLTVIGYSVNDTIVVFDRVRENVLSYPGRAFDEVVNHSISETLGRSINTSSTLLFTLLALLLFGGPTLQSFLLVLIIGVVAGTYSSIAIASQVLVAWEYGDLGRLFGRQTAQPTSTG